jgi:hypothetical protein
MQLGPDRGREKNSNLEMMLALCPRAMLRVPGSGALAQIPIRRHRLSVATVLGA